MVIDNKTLIDQLHAGPANPYPMTKGRGGPCCECVYKDVPKSIYPCNTCSIHNSKFIWGIKDE